MGRNNGNIMGNKQCGSCDAFYSQSDNDMVPFNDQPDSFQCLTCQGPKSGFVDADENSAPTPAPAPPVQVAVDPPPPAPGPPLEGQQVAAPRTRLTVKELTTEDPWVKYTRGRKLGGGTFGEVHEAVCKADNKEVAIKSIIGVKMTEKMKNR